MQWSWCEVSQRPRKLTLCSFFLPMREVALLCWYRAPQVSCELSLYIGVVQNYSGCQCLLEAGFVRSVCMTARPLASRPTALTVCCKNAQEPCRSFVLRDVICSYCNYCTDLDLCRDPALQVSRCASRNIRSVSWLRAMLLSPNPAIHSRVDPLLANKSAIPDLQPAPAHSWHWAADLA
jgi:hypothetical protein